MSTRPRVKRKVRRNAPIKGERAQAISDIRKKLDEQRESLSSIEVVVSSDDDNDEDDTTIKKKGLTKLPQTKDNSYKVNGTKTAKPKRLVGTRKKLNSNSSEPTTSATKSRRVAKKDSSESIFDSKKKLVRSDQKMKRNIRTKNDHEDSNQQNGIIKKESKKRSKKQIPASLRDYDEKSQKANSVYNNATLNEYEYSDFKYMLYLDESSGYYTKALFQIISQCFTTCCLRFNASGMSSEIVDDNDPFHVAMKLTIPRNRCEYMWGGKPDGKRVAAINPADLSKILRCIRRKFTVRFYELKSVPNILNIAISMDSKSVNDLSIGTINIFTGSLVDLKLPDVEEDNIPPIVLQTSFFQSALNQARDINNKQVTVWSKSRKIVFESRLQGLMGRTTESGVIFPNEKRENPFLQVFSFTILDKFRRVSTLADKMQFYLSYKYKYLRFRLRVGDSGELEVIINSYPLTHSGAASKRGKRQD